MAKLTIIVCVLLLSGCNSASDGKFELINSANVIVSKAEVSISNQNFIIENLKPNESVTREFIVKGDSSYNFTVYFIDGRKLIGQDGYVTSGFDYSDVIEITNSSVSIIDSDVTD